VGRTKLDQTFQVGSPNQPVNRIIKITASAAFANCTGVDVMITILCDFRHFSAKKLAFFSKTNVMIKFSQKSQFFAEFFGENI
jgi:hypothetical protein